MTTDIKNQNLELNIAYLYPRSMNIYGDRGNIISLINKSRQRGIKVNIDKIEIGDELKQDKYDLFFAGGGQDNNQINVGKDLQTKKSQIIKAVNRNAVFLLICGSYQLFGHYFQTQSNQEIQGIDILDLYTQAEDLRMIGNMVIKLNPDIYNLNPQTLVGFGNHSGATFIKNPDKNDFNKYTIPLGKVIKGYGNNSKSSDEGARYKNVFGTYLHGSLLPKNPHFTDYLIKTALENKYQRKITLEPIDNELELKAHNFIIQNR